MGVSLFRDSLYALLERNEFRNMRFENLLDTLEMISGADIRAGISGWDRPTPLPFYTIGQPEVTKITNKGQESFVLKQLVSNNSDNDGMLQLNIQIGGYGPRKGAYRILEILKEFDLKATWFIPAVMIEEHQAVVEKILDGGHENSHHGYDHTGRYGNTLEQQQEYVEKSQELFLKYTGRKACGMRPTGALLPETEKWLYDGGGFLYSSAGTSGEGIGYY